MKKTPCLQKELDATVFQRTTFAKRPGSKISRLRDRPGRSPTLLDRFDVFKKKVDVPATPSETRLRACWQSKNARETSSTVEKRLHIHSSKCAEARFLLAKAFLSKFRSAPVQCFSSSSGST
jgi:hypothetical protein